MFGARWFKKGAESQSYLSRRLKGRVRSQRRPRILGLELLEDRTLLGFEPPVSYAVGEMPSSVAVGDFDGDGVLDLAVANSKSKNVSVLLGNGDFTFRPAANYDSGGSPSAVMVGNFRGVGAPLDLVTANPDTNTVSVLLGNGDGTFKDKADYVAGLAPVSVAVGDFRGNGKLDIVTANVDGNSISVLLGNGDGTFELAGNYATGLRPTSVAVGDFRGNGKLDIVTANRLDDNVSVFLGNGDGTFKPAQNYLVTTDPRFVAVGDFNGDGIPDLVTANFLDNSISVLLGNGDGTFRFRLTEAVSGRGPSALVVDDFNKDGKLDIVTANSISGDVTVLLGVGDGSFQFDGNFAAGPGAVSVAAGDFGHSPGDLVGWEDVVTSDLLGDEVSVLENNYCPPQRPSSVSAARDSDPMREILTGAGQDAATGSLDAFFQHAGGATNDVVRLDGLFPGSEDGTGAVDHLGDHVELLFSPRAFGHGVADSWFRSFFDLTNNSRIDGLD
jgi:hypothetical protein